MSNIAKIASYSKWTLASSAIFMLVQAIQIVIITHFVSKDSFGYLSISNAFVFLCISLLDSGVVLSIIQAEKVSDSDIYHIVKFNLRFALILSSILVVISYLLAFFYGYQQIQEIMLYMIPFVVISAFNAVFIAKMRRDLEFKLISILEIISVLMSAAVVVYTAMIGFEYLSIVIGYLIKVLILAILLFFTKKTHILAPGSTEKINSKHLDFGKYIYGEKLLTAIMSNADALIIGRLIGMSDLGAYDIFKKIILRPFIIFYDSIERVVFSLISRLNNEPKEFRALYQSFSTSINCLVFPGIALVFLNINFLLGLFPESYQSYGSTLRLFILLIFAITVLNPIDLILYAQGKSKLFLKWMLAYAIPFLFVLWFSATKGLNTLILAYGVFYLLIYLLAYFVVIKKETPLDAIAYFKPVILPALFTVLGAGILDFVFGYLNVGSLIRLVCSLLIFIAVFYSLMRKEGSLKTLFINKL